MSAVRETAWQLEAASTSVTVVVSHPSKEEFVDSAEPPPCVLLMNAGLTHHVGPHRLHVRLARELAQQGWLAARFDFGGLGDSGVRHGEQSFDDACRAEATAVMDRLARDHGVDRFATLGLCSGGRGAFALAVADARVRAAVLVNPRLLRMDAAQGRDWESYATRRTDADFYLRTALFRAESWRRLFTGKSSLPRLASALLLKLRELFVPNREIRKAKSRLVDELGDVVRRGADVLLLVSAGDQAEELARHGFGRSNGSGPDAGRIDLHVVRDTDHTFTLGRSQDEFAEVTVRWLGACSAARAAAPHD